MTERYLCFDSACVVHLNFDQTHHVHCEDWKISEAQKTLRGDLIVSDTKERAEHVL